MPRRGGARLGQGHGGSGRQPTGSARPPTLAGLRDRALLTLGFYAAARASDLAQLLVGDIAVEGNGLVVTVRVGKTGESADVGRHVDPAAANDLGPHALLP